MKKKVESGLKYILFVISVVALISGLNVVVGGAAAVPGALGPAEVTVDNELRFFAMFWVAFGGFCFWVARNLQEQSSFVPFIALVFLAGGVGRLISVLTMGMPAGILMPAMVLEFVVPAVVYILYLKLYQTNETSDAI